MSAYEQYYPINKMFFKTYVGKTLKYCITWLNWDPKDLAMVTEDSLINFSRSELDNIKSWRDYKKEINYKSTFANYARENKINLTCTYDLSNAFEKIGTVSGIPSKTIRKRKLLGEEVLEPVKRAKWVPSNLEDIADMPELEVDDKVILAGALGPIIEARYVEITPLTSQSFSRVANWINMAVMVLAFILHVVMLYVNFGGQQE